MNNFKIPDTIRQLLNMAVEIDKDLVKIINDEMGKSSADLFVKFYHGFTLLEQVKGANQILSYVVGATRTKELLKDYLEN